jgi:hypothetical protein
MDGVLIIHRLVSYSNHNVSEPGLCLYSGGTYSVGFNSVYLRTQKLAKAICPN